MKIFGKKLFAIHKTSKVPHHLIFKKRTITVEDVSQAIKDFFTVDADPKYVSANLGHSWRYFVALKYIIDHELYAGKIFEAGGAGVFTYIIKSLLGDINIYSHDGDLRKPVIINQSINQDYFDVVLCMEVIEHITDEQNYHEMRFEGVKTCMQSFFQIMKPKGRLFITTPNISSYLSLSRLLRGAHPMTYPIHVREYTPREIKMVAENIGFETEILTTENCFYETKSYKKMIRLLKRTNYSLENRGDDIIAIFIKPENIVMRNPDYMKDFLS